MIRTAYRWLALLLLLVPLTLHVGGYTVGSSPAAVNGYNTATGSGNIPETVTALPG